MTDDTPPTPAPTRSRKRAATTDPAALSDADSSAAAEPSADAAVPLVETLRLERGGISEATAGAVDVHMGGIGAVTADDVFVQWGGVGAARAEKVGVEFGGVGAALTSELRVTQGWARAVIARDATLEQSLARTVIAQHVEVRRPSAVLVLIAQRVEGDVRTLLDWRGALAFGAAFGLVAGLARAGALASNRHRGSRRFPRLNR